MVKNGVTHTIIMSNAIILDKIPMHQTSSNRSPNKVTQLPLLNNLSIIIEMIKIVTSI